MPSVHDNMMKRSGAPAMQRHFGTPNAILKSPQLQGGQLELTTAIVGPLETRQQISELNDLSHTETATVTALLHEIPAYMLPLSNRDHLELPAYPGGDFVVDGEETKYTETTATIQAIREPLIRRDEQRRNASV